MNRLILAFIICCISLTASAQMPGPPPPVPTAAKEVTSVKEWPTFNGNLDKWMEAHLRYPDEARKSKATGIAHIAVTIKADGTLVNPTVQTSSGSAVLDNEALRVVRKMPRWKPARRDDGVPTSVFYTISISFGPAAK